MRSMNLTTALLTMCLLLAGPMAAAQQMPQLTPEQQRMLDMLPASQRAELLRQYQQMPNQRREAASIVTPSLSLEREIEAQRRREMFEQEPQPEDEYVIRPGDTLIIEVMFPPTGEGQPAVPGEHLLRGKHTLQLDRFGRLSMPGIEEVPLAGLNSYQAEMRLMAEPALRDMMVMVTRLTLTPVGRDALEPFGYQIFKRPMDWMSMYRQRPSMPVPADYTVGPGDSVEVQLFGKDFAQHYLVVTREGTLQVPGIGPVAVAGMRYSDMKSSLERRIQEQTIGVQAAVTMGELRSIEVFVVGDVKRPGAHQVGGLSTIINALYEADGITDIGSLRQVRLIRNGELHTRFDLYDLLLRGNPRGDARLQPGDVIFVPATGARAGLMGEALRPAWYELRGETSLGALLDLAGGTGPEADARNTQIQRIGSDGNPQFIDVDATTRQGRAQRLQQGDLVVIPRANRVAEHTVVLRGHFALPGVREWKAGLRLSDLIPGVTALNRDPDLDYGLVVRHLPGGHGRSIHMFSPRAILADASTSENLMLSPRDEVLIFSYQDNTGRRALIDPLIEMLRQQATRGDGARIARVTGAVRAPGFYPLSDGMRLSDLVRAGGGAAESAYLDEAEITRYEVANGMTRRIEHIEVSFAGILAGQANADIRVRPYDVLNVKQTPMWTERGIVELRGEVRFPGTYQIRPGEMLSDVINRAGGVTELAFPHAAVFTRENLREREQAQIDQMISRLEADIATASQRTMDADSQQAQAMATSLVQQLRQSRAAGRLVIDLERLMRNPGNEHFDVLAQDGDLLVVPPRSQEVTVMGEVYFPTSHIYDPDLRQDNYLQRSGGLTYRADGKRIYVVRANGSVEAVGEARGRRSPQIFPGDTIVVPVDIERVPAMVRFMNISQIVYQLGVAAAAWNSIGVF